MAGAIVPKGLASAETQQKAIKAVKAMNCMTKLDWLKQNQKNEFNS